MTNRFSHIKLALACLLLTFAAAGIASATVLGFEDLTSAPPAGGLPAGYFGFNWTGDWAHMTSTYANATWGTNNGFSLTMNGSHAIYTTAPTGGTITRATGRFRINSLVAGAAWNDNQYVWIQGRRAGAPVNNWFGVVKYGAKTTIVLNWTNIDALVISPYGSGTPHSGVAGAGNAICIDDMNYTAPPWVSSVNPASGVNNATVTGATVNGTGFLTGATVALKKTGQTTINATAVSVVSDSQITCNLPITNAAAGAWDVVVTNTDATTGTLTGGFTVTNAAPTATSVSPAYAPNTASIYLTVTGTGFLGVASSYNAANPAIKLTRTGYSDIVMTAGSAYLYSSTSCAATLPITGAAAGQWNVVVTNNDAQSVTLANAFTVLSGAYPTPTVTGIVATSGPTTGQNQAPNTGPVNVQITGTGFFVPPGPGGPTMGAVTLTHTFPFQGGTGGAGIVATNVVVVNSTTITCTFNITGQGWGLASPWNVSVTPPNGAAAVTLNNCFAITTQPITVTAITPNWGMNTSSTTISITGTNFQTNMPNGGYGAGQTVTVSKTGQTSMVVTSIYSNSTTQMSSIVLPTTGKAVGAWDVTVTTGDQSVTVPGGFTIYGSAKPTVTSITPNWGTNDGPVAITNLVGTGFVAGATVSLKKTGQADIVAAGVTVSSATLITCSFDLTNAVAGTWDVAVSNPGSPAGTLAAAFTVLNAPPLVTAITPNSGADGSTVNISNLAGLNFIAGDTVKLQMAGQPDINATSVVIVSRTQITCSFNLTNVAPGAWDVVVTDNTSQTATFSGGFTVTAPAPTVTSITPATAANTGSVSITNLAGTGFLPGVTVSLKKTGQTDIPGTSVTIVSPTQITCAFNLTGAALGVWDVVATNTDLQAGTLAGGFSITGPAPTVTGITPNTGLNTSTVAITNLAGTNFVTGASVKLTKTGQTAITATGVTVLGPTQITCTFNLVGAATGAWDVVVTNPDLQSATLAGGFTVSNPAPTVTDCVPYIGYNNGTTNITALSGTGFMAGATVKLQKTGQTDIPATSVVVVSATQITCSVNFTGAAVGAWDVTVTNPDSQSGTLSDGILVLNPPPVVSAITPNTGVNTGSVGVTNLAGTGFRTGASVTLRKTGQADIVATGVTVASPTQITCTLNLTGAATGAWDVVVTNTDLQAGVLAGGFTVTATGGPPTVTAITPNAGLNTGSVSITNLAGTNFLPGASVKLTKAGQFDIVGTSVNVVNSAQITCTFNLTGAAIGAWNVVVTNTDLQQGALVGGFTVSNPAPTVTSITPSSGANNGSVAITSLVGTGFLPGASVKLTLAGQADIVATGVTVSPTQIACSLNLTGALPGLWNVVVTNADLQAATLTNGFTVTYPAPTVTSIAPASAPNTGSVNITSLVGTGFLAGASVTLTKAGQPTITATSVSVVSPTQITCTFNLSGAVTGAWDVVVTNTDLQFGTLAGGFTVGTPAPTVTGITPTTGLNNGSVSITNLAGTGFLTGATAKLTKAGQTDIPGASVVVVSPTQITCTFNLAGAATGTWNVVVTNTDLQSGTFANGFTVNNPAPTVTSITPSSGLNTGSVSITNLTGTGFLPGATVKLAKTGQTSIVAPSVTVVGPTQITCSLNLTGAAAGPWDVVVTNTDSQSGALAGGFTITAPAPTITAITPNTGLNSGSVSVTNLAGTGFLPGATVVLKKTGQPNITATGVTVVSATKITCTLPLTGAVSGAWDVVVTNTDSQFATLTGGFTVGNPAPTVTAITPNTGLNNGSVNITNLAGTGFLSGASVTLTQAGQPNITATSVSVVSPSLITCTVNLTGVATGAWNVVVTNADTKSGTLTGGFTVSYPAPTVTAITPNGGATGASVPITNLAGTGFRAGATVKFRKTGQTDITATSVSVGSATQITCTVGLTGAVAGAWDVVVTNSDLLSGTLAGGFTVRGAAPTVTSITPNSGTSGGTVSITNLAGTGFLSGATVTLTGAGLPTITATGVTVVSPTLITCTLSLASATAGTYNVVVTNPDTQLGTLASGFTVLRKLR